MGLTKVSTDGVKDDAITAGKIPANAIGVSELASSSVTNVKVAAGNIDNTAIGNNQVSLNKLVQGTSSNDGKFLRANNGANPSFESPPAGLAVFDQWRLTTGQTITTQDVVLTAWERPDTSGTGGGAYGGSGLSQSSGVFSFPTTGIYLITYQGQFNATANTRYSEIDIVVTKNNSSYVEVARSFFYFNRPTGTSTGASATCSFLMDVDNISNDKVRFECSRADVGDFQVLGDSTINMTTVTFLRLGDT
tara:strand:- start:392 stop:1138 length:747 start_codon:yes stop_codon:yes gene_type:complete